MSIRLAFQLVHVRLLARTFVRKATATSTALVIAALMLVLPGRSASAAPVPQVYDNGTIRITSFPSDEMTALQVGVPADWQIAVLPLVPGSGQLKIGLALTSDPALATGLDIEVRACPQQWVAGSCPGGGAHWLSSSPVSTAFTTLDLGGVAHLVGTIDVTTSNSPTWMLLRMTPNASISHYALAEFLMAVSGQGEPMIVGPGRFKLAKTGVSNGGMLLGIALGFAIVGAALTANSRIRSISATGGTRSRGSRSAGAER